MHGYIRLRLRALFALLFVTALVASGGEARALSSGCEVFDRYGVLRKCTFSEELAACYQGAYDSYYQCMDDAYDASGPGTIGGAWAATQCQLGLWADLAACTMTSPVKGLIPR